MPVMRTVEQTDCLRTCPFCGKVPYTRHEVYNRKAYEWDDGWTVECSNNDCDVRPVTGRFYSKELAVNAWNTRHTDGE